MLHRIVLPTAMLLLAFAHAEAATFTADIRDDSGKPVVNAVVTLLPQRRTAMPAPSSRLTAEKIIDQRDETFVPLVTIIPKGGHIVFTNNDLTTHQVYSFSAVRQFEMTLARGQTSQPVRFDSAGVAALGCNIHDHMIAYAYVAESPWTAMTAADGRAEITDVPDGTYDARIWHPQLPPGREQPSVAVAVTGATAKLATTIRLLAPPVAHAHGGSY